MVYRESVANRVSGILSKWGDATNAEVLENTPARVERALDELLSGYDLDPEAILAHLRDRLR